MNNALNSHEKYKRYDEQELITRTQNGDAEAFNPLVRKYQQKIYNLIYHKVRDQEAAKDLCQEAFLKAWQALPKFKRQSTFYTWLYQIAVNCSIDFLRQQNKQIVFACEELPQNADDVLPMLQVHPSTYQVLEQKELGDIIRIAISHLPPGQRSVFRLRYFHDLPIKIIATRMNKSEGTVKTHLYHARRKLRIILLPYLQNEPLEW